MKPAKIAVLACKWYPMIGLEDARKQGVQVPPETTVIPIKCTGVVKASLVLGLFARGFDGVLVLGCSEDDCRYLSGSSMCKQVADEVRKILAISGIEERRFGFELMSEGSGEEFSTLLGRFTKRLSPRGRSGVGSKSNR